MRLPAPRGNTTAAIFAMLAGAPGATGDVPMPDDDPLGGEDFQLALYACYELHYRSFDGVSDDWEWDPALLAVRRRLEGDFTDALRDAVRVPQPTGPVEEALAELVAVDSGPSLSTHLGERGTAAEYREFLVHRSAYQLKEADPHTWAIPRLWGPPKAALIEIQTEEYGDGNAAAMHSALFTKAMDALGLDATYGAYLDAIPGVTLATVNLMSMFGLHRRWRGALVGHLASFEMTSTEPNRRYAEGLRRLGFGDDAMHFFLEHVEADATHEILAARDLAGGFVAQEPDAAKDVLFGAASMLELESRFAGRVLDAWLGGRTSLRDADVLAMSA